MKLLEALRGCNLSSSPPIWFMRQAGRLFPAYRELRTRYSFSTLLHTPALASHITQMPLESLGVDAAILFSDILVVTEVLGYRIDFEEGKGMHLIPPLQPRRGKVICDLNFVAQTISLLKPQLSVPLIGFCGGPYSVAKYMNALSTATLDLLTEVTLEYLHLQIEAGVDVIQIFDSWAGWLEREEFLTLSLPYLKRLIEGVRKTGLPLILFMRGGSRYVQELVELAPTALSFDWEEELFILRKIIPPQIALQGNLNPALLFSPLPELKKEVLLLLSQMAGQKNFIFNLGHGVLPGTELEQVKEVVKCVKGFASQLQPL